MALHLMTLLHLIFSFVWVLWNVWPQISLPVIWFVLGFILFLVALVASKEPIDEYGYGV